MEKLLMLRLNLIGFISLLSLNCISQTQCDCSDKKTQDSLVVNYIENGAKKYSYNNPKWGIYCDSLIDICPNISLAYREKAIPYIKAGNFAKAMPLEDKAVELDPVAWTAYRAFLKVIFTKDYEGGIADFEKAKLISLSTYTMDHTFNFYEGISYLELENYNKAIEYLEKDIWEQMKGKTDKDVHFNSYLYLGITYLEMQEYDKAEYYLTKGLSINKHLPEGNYYLAVVYSKQSKIKESRAYFKLAKEKLEQGYNLSEDNEIYVNYPHQITIHEVNAAMNY